MKILAIDAALGSFSAAVRIDDALHACIDAPGNVALEQGLKVVRQVLEAAGLEGASLDRIAVGNGPGGFTGLRIALSYAKALALAWNKPLVAVSSFDALETGLHCDGPVLAVVRGRTGVISVRYRDGGEERFRGSGRTSEVLDAWLAAEGHPRGVAVVGAPEDVLLALAERAVVVNAYEPAVVPAAAAIAEVARRAHPAASLHIVRADYGELPAATVPKF